MVDNYIPFVAIIGGFAALKNDPAKFSEARETAKEIGAALANAGMGLLVYFSDDESLEPHVVSGYVAALPAGSGRGRIRVRFAESQKNHVKFAQEATHNDVFDRILFAGNDWEAPFYRSLAAADGVDAVLLMAGARSTLIAGQIALARGLPVLAIDKFDGSAGTIRTELAIAGKSYPSSTTQTTNQMVEWLKADCESRFAQRALARDREKRYLEVTSQRDKSIWAGTAFLVLLGLIVYGLSQAPDPGFYPSVTFFGLIAAGATGALVRSVFWGTEVAAPLTSLVLGGVAGFVVGMAYLIPQWVGAQGLLKAATTEVLPTDKIQFVSAVLVAISAGVGFDTIFNRLKKQADDLKLGPTN